MADPGSMAVKVGLMALQIGLNMLNKFEGPRLDSLDVSLADYGAPIPRLWGERRLDGCSIIWAEKIREVKKESKGKTGKYAEYEYFGTWAVLLTDTPIDSVKELYLDKLLVISRSRKGPLAHSGSRGGGTIKLQLGRNYKVYDGTQTEPDPRIEAWCEDKYGAGTCPAYKGASYIIFKDIPLEKFGNRIPQVAAIVVRGDAPAYLTETKTTADTLANLSFSEDFSRFVMNGEMWDTASRTRLTSGSALFGGNSDIDGNGVIYDSRAAAGAGHDLHIVGSAGLAENASIHYDSYGGQAYALGAKVYLAGASSAVHDMIIYHGGAIYVTVDDVGFFINHYFATTEGGVYGVGVDGTTVKFVDAASGIVSSVATGSSAEPWAVDNGVGGIFLLQGSTTRLIDKATWTVTATGTVSGAVLQRDLIFRNAQFGAVSIWLGTQEISTETLAVLRSVDMADWGLSGGSAPDWLVYDPINHALIAHANGSGQLVWCYLDRISGIGVTLQSVIEEVGTWAGVTVDAAECSQLVRGYSVTQGSGKDILQPLLDIHDVDPRPHDFTCQFINRGRTSAGTILTADFARDGDAPRYAVTISQDTDLPRRVTLNFADVDRDQQPNNVIAQRDAAAVDSARERTVDMTTYAETVGNAQKFVDRYFRRQWNSRETIANALTAQHLALEPGDVRTLDLDGVTRNARCIKTTLSGGMVKAEWTRDALTLNALGTGTGSALDGQTPQTIIVPGPVNGMVLDMPLMADGDTDLSPLLYYGAGGYGGDFYGATILKRDGGGIYASWNGIDTTMAAEWGYATSVLATANPWLWDRGNSLTVKLYGTLTSATEADLDADPMLNLAALGDEWLQFATATLTGTQDGANLYTLSGFKRGRRGTEWAVGSHAVGELFVLAADLEHEAVGMSEVGLELSFQTMTLTRPPTGQVDFTFAGNSLKPYAPARVKWVYDGTDLQGTIYRRTRVGGAWVGGTTIPLSENSEEYEVECYNGATLKRTITVSGTTSFTYTAAMASADGISLPTPPTLKVYQLSDAVGRGFELAA